jgi:FtsP/CotA-like multicopper oxidase with cupredoxin domain
LNGKNVKPDGSAGQRPVWTVKRGKKYLFRFINTSVDNHIMTVVQTDFVPIKPYNTTSISIGIGKRPPAKGGEAVD